MSTGAWNYSYPYMLNDVVMARDYTSSTDLVKIFKCIEVYGCRTKGPYDSE